MPKETKAGDMEVEHRIEVISTLLSRFTPRYKILQYVAKKTDWGISASMVDEYISKAKKRIRKTEKPDVLKGIIHKELSSLYGKNLEKEDFKECRSILESMAKLFGVNEPEKTETEMTISWNEEKTYEK